MKRHGFTLIELIAVMAVLAVVLGFSVMMFVRLFEFQQSNDEYADGVRGADRFITDFRYDVHTFGQPKLLSGGGAIRWDTEPEVIEYTTVPGEFPDQVSVVRTVYKDGRQTHYEAYRLPDRSELRFVEGENTSYSGLVALSLWTTPRGIETPDITELNPFDRTIPKNLEERIDPKFAGNWRTIIVRY